jgi:integrase
MGRHHDTEARVLGPARHAKGWKVTLVDPQANGGAGRRSYRYFRELEAAQDWKLTLDARLQRLAGFTVARTLDDYEAHLKLNNTEDYAVELCRRLRLFFEPVLGHQLGRLTEERAGELYTAFRARTYTVGSEAKGTLRQKPYSVAHHRHGLITARSFLRWCVKKKLVNSNPLDEVEGVGKRDTGKPTHNADEAQRLYKWVTWKATRPGPAARADREAAIGVLMCQTMALRSSDVRKRLVRDVELGASRLGITGGKSKKSNRPRRIPAPIQPLVRQLAANRQALEPLFLADKGGFHTKTWLRAAMQRFCRDAGVPYIPPHGLKGTAGAIADEVGALADQIADFLSHEETRTGDTHYVPGMGTEGQAARALAVITGGKA